MSNRVVSEGNIVEFTAAADLVGGDVVVIGELVGMVSEPVADTETGQADVSSRVEVPRETGASMAHAAGDPAYWDVSESRATVTSTGNVLMGKWADAGDDNQATAHVLLNK